MPTGIYKHKCRVPREIRICALEGCTNTFEVYKSESRRFCCPRCARKFVMSFKEVRDKISNTLSNNEEFKKMRKEIQTQLWKDPEYRKMMVDAAKNKKNRIPIETRICANEKCNNTFECRVDFTKRFCSNSCSAKYRILSKETREKIGKTLTGKKQSEETRKKKSEATVGKKKHEGFGKKISEARLAYFDRGGTTCFFNTGKDHPGWKGGIGNQHYTLGFNERLKNLIRERDNYLCQLCGRTKEEKGRNLCVHHVDYIKEHINPENLITLCNRCNSKVNTNREYWTNFFQEKLRLINKIENATKN